MLSAILRRLGEGEQMDERLVYCRLTKKPCTYLDPPECDLFRETDADTSECPWEEKIPADDIIQR